MQDVRNEEYRNMVRIMIHGCSGHMGHVVARMAAEDPDVEVIAGVDPFGEADQGFPVYRSFEECPVKADVVIDFSTAAAVDALMEYCRSTQTPLVLCTTGLSETQTGRMHEIAEEIPVLKSANMSLGINLLMKLLKEAAAVLAPAGFDIEIEERHHNRKLDSPSGTAYALADAINAGLEKPYAYNTDRSHDRKKREHDEIGIVGLRGGTIVGEHTVMFAGEDEVIEFKHTSYSRDIFAKGALQGAKYLAGKPAGFYGMKDVIDQEG